MIDPEPVQDDLMPEGATPNTLVLDTAQVSVDDTPPAEGDTVTLERVEGTVRRTEGGRVHVEITSVGGEPLPSQKPPRNPDDEALEAAAASDRADEMPA